MTRDSTWWRYDTAAERISVTLHVQPNARKSGIVGRYGDALKVRVAAPATNNQAHAALIDFLSEALGISKAAITIRHGAASRRKVVEIRGEGTLAEGLNRL